MRVGKRIFAFLVVAGLPIALATAQNYQADPSYGTVTLESGFEPDPHVVELQAGGTISAADISASCQGNIANAPDVRLEFVSGAFPLIVSVDAATDTTLVINDPTGRWFCNDDAGQGSNPAIWFNPAPSGRYEIWVGTYGREELQPARLEISEITSR